MASIISSSATPQTPSPQLFPSVYHFLDAIAPHDKYQKHPSPTNVYYLHTTIVSSISERERWIIHNVKGD